MPAALGALLFVSSALASSHNPEGEFAQFKERPLNNAEVTDCLFLDDQRRHCFLPIVIGDTLPKTAQPVPGSLLEIIAPTWWPKEAQEWFNKGIAEGSTGVNATVELAGPTKGLTSVKLNTETCCSKRAPPLACRSKSS